MSPAEAKGTDPQQRLLLEQTYRTFAQAGFTKRELMDRGTGIFIGIMNADFAELTRGSTSVCRGPGGLAMGRHHEKLKLLARPFAL